MSNKFEEKEFSEEFDSSMWKKLFALFRPFYKHMAALALLNALIALSDVIFPLMNRRAMDHFAVGSGTNEELIGFIIMYFLLILITALMHLFYFRVAGAAEMGFAYNLRQKCFEKLQNLPFSYYDVTPTGWLLSRLTSDISRLAEILAWSLTEFAWGIPLIVFSTIVMLRTNVQLALMVLIVVPILAFVTFYFQKRVLRSYRKVRKFNSVITNDFNEGINGAKTTKTLVLEDTNFKEFKNDTAKMREASVKAAKIVSIYRPLATFLSSFTLALILWIGGTLVFKKTIGFGILMMFTEYAQRFFEPLQSIAMIMQDIQMAQASGERIISLMNYEIKLKDSDEVVARYGTILDPKPQEYEKIKGDVEFRNVDFSYIEEEPVLTDFNLKVNAGQTIALVGETGSGKSTIVNLLCRFYEPVKGQLLIDGVDYRERSIGWLHSNLGYVLQAPHLFSGTIKDNIRFGKLDATDEEIENAAKLVHAHEFIMQFKDGYQTDVGESGSRLSTGQKQLISFARAILADPAIFVLDEATASIDTETEHIIQNAIETIMSERTSFVVAHRLSTIVNADRILVIKKGKIVEDGTHSSLMKLKGYYYRLYTNQFEEDMVRESLTRTATAGMIE
ncbi:MAG: ABC transporter ATP-binding protein [Erysipelotrichaceae bacterium]|nr:ABC transporter ATP-binding protein [Erysipelotrichaceae bacterium]